MVRSVEVVMETLSAAANGAIGPATLQAPHAVQASSYLRGKRSHGLTSGIATAARGIQIGCGPIHRVSALFLSPDRVAVPLTIGRGVDGSQRGAGCRRESMRIEALARSPMRAEERRATAMTTVPVANRVPSGPSQAQASRRHVLLRERRLVPCAAWRATIRARRSGTRPPYP